MSFGPLNQGLSDTQARERVEEALGLLAIAELGDVPVHRLSYGQRKRVAIAGVVAMRPRLLLLDEPTSALDPAGVLEMLTALERLEERSTTVVIATHDVDLALRWADQVAVVVDGCVVAGDPGVVLGDRDLIARARLRLPWVLDVADLGALPRGRAVVFASGVRPTLVRTLPWMTGPRAAEVRASIARFDPATQITVERGPIARELSLIHI